jgi:pyruvate,orthophosphate dikinase
MKHSAITPAKTKTTKLVFAFGPNIPTPALDSTILGGKGKGLAEMASINLPVPPGFIISTEACNEYRHLGRAFPDGLEAEIQNSIQLLEKETGLQFGHPKKPLLVSVRSGARVSMPGMMDTVLDLGLNDESVKGFALYTQNARLAYDSYRRFIMMFSDIVFGVSRKHFEEAFEVVKIQEKVKLDSEVSIDGLKETCKIFKTLFEQHANSPFPQDAYKQLHLAISAVFNSWDSERATLYRELNHIPGDWGTAVTVQIMVFGNKNSHSATGVAFTRDPATGDNHFYGEFLVNAQGEEIVAGIRTPHPINKIQKEKTKSRLESLEELMPDVYEELHSIVKILERHYKDMQDIEFTIEDSKLYMLQTRSGKRTGFAAVKVAIDMLKEGLIDEKSALKHVEPTQLVQLLAPVFDNKAKVEAKNRLAAKGLNAGPGAASGQAVFSSEKAVELKKQGIRVILVRDEASPSDFPGMVAAEGILTMRGGSTSHAAVVARGMGKPCIVGCGSLFLNDSAKTLSTHDMTLHEGDAISIDGTTGEVFFAALPTSPSEIVQVLVTKTKKPADSSIFQQYNTLMNIADKYRTLEVRANADTPLDSEVARDFGAQGVGLCRTEHMFMNPHRLNDVRCMFFSTHPEERKKAINRLLPHQKSDFIGIFQAMKGLPVTIRLLDPPLHEFMPHSDEEQNALASQMGLSLLDLAKVSAALIEHNPMLGHRGCRLGVTYPELTEMQTRAILEAAIVVKKQGIDVHPEIMVPLVGIEGELVHQKALIDKTAKLVFEEQKCSLHYSVGTMIELPRSALLADTIAKHAAFFSFGTNDLTQTTFGISRDDSAKFVPTYVKGIINPLAPDEHLHILEDDPFQVLDREGVGQLMKIAIERGHKTRPDLQCGICGEHGGDPKSIAFCHMLGLDYVSCSPYRVPIARLAAAIAAL